LIKNTHPFGKIVRKPQGFFDSHLYIADCVGKILVFYCLSTDGVQ